MMRIVAVADTHTFEEDLDVPEGDVFVHAGDMCRGGRLDELAVVARWIRSLPHPHKIVIAGNHDRCFETKRAAAEEVLGEGIHYLQDSGLTLDGVRFWGSPWQPEFHNWAFNLPRGEPLAEKWAMIPGDTDVLITHGPPHGFGDRAADHRGAGCRELLAAARRVRPRLHMYGHIHQDGGVWRDGDICFANVTTWECDRAPTVFDYDVQTGEVHEVFVPDRRIRF